MVVQLQAEHHNKCPFKILQNRMTLELHQAQGVEHRTLGTCQVKFRDVIHTNGERVHYTMPLTGKPPAVEDPCSSNVLCEHSSLSR